jgi:dTDP-4-amino-4,6-dideoxygalactose transaminase
MTVPFVDLTISCTELRHQIASAVGQSIDGVQFILGEQVAIFEQQFAEFSGAAHCIGVGNGTEALHLTLRALGIGSGDEVITAANTFIATALAIAYTGASPVVVDVDPKDYLIDVELIERAITPRTKAIVPVHLYGQPANLPAILKIADKHGLAVVQDACQAHGASIDGSPIAALGAAACFSFYPSKNLGACGDGGAIVTNCDKLAGRLRMLRNYGQKTKNEFEMLGYNSRLDTLQAAILGAKLPYLDRWNDQRRAAAAVYAELLADSELVLPIEHDNVRHVYHLYVVRHPRRDDLLAHLRRSGVECGIHYPTPIHQIAPFRGTSTVPDAAPVSCRLAQEILSLPMYPGIKDDYLHRVKNAVQTFSQVAANN